MRGSKSPTLSKAQARSRVTNGASLLPKGADGRSLYVRRFRDLIALHLADLGGPDNVSEAEKSIVRRAATITISLEKMEMRMATDDEDTPAFTLDLYQRLSNSLRRLLESVGLKRRAKDITPDLNDYLRTKASRTWADDADDAPALPKVNGRSRVHQ